MTFNIQHGVGYDGKLNLQRIGDVIKNAGAEVIGLQEVDRHWDERSDFEDQVRWLAKYLNMNYFYGANLTKAPEKEGTPRGEYGLATLSKFPIVRSHHHYLTSDQEQRGLLKAEININQEMICFLNTHLGLHEAERNIQIREILAHLAEEEKPTIIVGDFNATPTSYEMVQLFNIYHDVQELPTFPAHRPTEKIDYLLISDQLEKVDAKAFDTLASDHLPIFAELNLLT